MSVLTSRALFSGLRRTSPRVVREQTVLSHNII